MTDGKKIRYDPSAASADPNVPGFIARPAGAPVYHGFPIVPETMTDGWVYGAITEFEVSEPQTWGDGFVIAPDGSRAGIAWATDTPDFYEILPPDKGRWGVYGVRFPRPVSCLDDLIFNFRAVLPRLQERYALLQKIPPLSWPESTRNPKPLQKFFLNFPWFGPDRRAYRMFRKQAASRPDECMALWRQDERVLRVRDIVLDLLMRDMRWRTRKFVPGDPCDILFFHPLILCAGEDAMFAFLALDRRLGYEGLAEDMKGFKNMTLSDLVEMIAKKTKKV